MTRVLLPFAVLALATVACRGGISEKPPVHLVPDMDFQPKVRAQSANDFWTDGRGVRTPVPGTIARGTLPGPLHRYETADGSYVSENPLDPSIAVLERGRERYEIHCAPCHGLSGRGGNGPDAHGTVGRLWPVAIPSFIDDERVSQLPDAEVFDVITNGRNTMPRYAHQVGVEDRWAIIHYIRALQLQAENL